MSINEEKIKWAKSLYRYLFKISNEEEKRQVEEWLKSPRNYKLFQDIKEQKLSRKLNNFFVDNRLERREFIKIINTRKNKFYNYVVASISGFIVLFSLLFLYNRMPEINTTASIINSLDTVKINYNKTTLYTSTGEKVVMNKYHEPISIKELNGIKINITGDSLSYNLSKKSVTNNTKKVYNTIKVPKCGNFYFIMEDGTKVWLNSKTVIKYPIPFSKDVREIVLDGEAFFDVKKDKERPFIVKIKKGEIKVLGTKFNVTSYNNDIASATLVVGSIQVEDNAHNKLILKPSERIILDGDDLRAEVVDTHFYTAWKDGYFVYYERTLDEILKDLSDWYDFEYFYQNKELANIVLIARLKKFDNLKDTLEILEEIGGIKFSLKNKSIVVSTNI